MRASAWVCVCVCVSAIKKKKGKDLDKYVYMSVIVYEHIYHFYLCAVSMCGKLLIKVC